MPELQFRPVQSPAAGFVTREHDPVLWRTAQLRYRDHLSRGGGVFGVGIPPDPDSPEANDWVWRSLSEIAVHPPVSFMARMLRFNHADAGVFPDQVVPARLRSWIIHPEQRSQRNDRPTDPPDRWKTLNWPQVATALLAPERMIHGWIPQWNNATSTTVAGRPGARVPLVLKIPWSDERSYGDYDQPHWMDLYTEHAEMVIDDEHGVILEWNGLVDGEVFERNAFTAIDFDVQLTERDFDPDALGLTKH